MNSLIKVVAFWVACWGFGHYLLGPLIKSRDANHYNQMIRTCEATLSENQKCRLIAVPYIGETK